MKEDVAKEIAGVAAYIYWAEVGIATKGSFFQTFDEAYEVAKAFVEKYPLETQWGVDNDGIEYDEAIELFVKKYNVV